MFPDTNVLFPVRLINLIMRSHAAGLITVVWTDELLDELRRILVEKRGLTPTRAQTISDRITAWAPDGRIPPDRYAARVADMVGPDPADHVHAAAASVGADVLCTNNVRDFAVESLDSCRVLTPAALFAELGQEFGQDFARLLAETSAELRSPRRTAAELLEDLRAIGLTGFADSVAVYLQ